MGIEAIVALISGVIIGVAICAAGIWTIISAHKTKTEMAAGFNQLQQQLGQALKTQQEAIDKLTGRMDQTAPISAITELHKTLTELAQRGVR